jgi:hypothetical protein
VVTSNTGAFYLLVAKAAKHLRPCLLCFASPLGTHAALSHGLVSSTDHIRLLTKAQGVYSVLLRGDAERIRDGLIREGMIATETLENIARAQEVARSAELK